MIRKSAVEHILRKKSQDLSVRIPHLLGYCIRFLRQCVPVLVLSQMTPWFSVFFLHADLPLELFINSSGF